MRDRFREIEDYRALIRSHDNGARPRDAFTSDRRSPEHVDVVFAEGPARPGYVGDMLAGVPGEELKGGSMTVLAGHTISCWVVERGFGQPLEAHIRRRNEQFGDPDARVFHESVPLRPGATFPPEPSIANSFWLAWSCPDKPGILRKIVDRLRGFVREVHDGTLVDVDIKYGISRVLADERGCVGKVNFLVTNDMVAKEFGTSLLALEREVRRLLDDERRGRYSSHPSSGATAVLTSTSEPGEEPWASLAIGGPASRGVGANVPAARVAARHRGYRPIWLTLALLAVTWTFIVVAVARVSSLLLAGVALLGYGAIALSPVLAIAYQRRRRRL
jgi:hypothetical protein